MLAAAARRLRPFLPRSGPALALAAGLLAMAPECAMAQMDICNRIPGQDSIRVAVAFAMGDEHASKGWFTARQGQCVTVVEGALDSPLYWVHVREHPSRQAWFGPFFFCTARGAFRVLGRDQCAERGHRSEGFFTLLVADERYRRLTLVNRDSIRAEVATLRVSERPSLTIEGTRVLVVHNPTQWLITLDILCASAGGGRRRPFVVTMQPYASSELGYVQGWEGNFTAGQSCEAYYLGIPTWTHVFR
jgi:uncharacterized membrane protein